MKKIVLVLLLLGLMTVWGTQALAVDVKVSGEYYAAGLYLDKTSLIKDAAGNVSTAFFYQRLRLNGVFVVSPGLMLTTRADIMERAWGATRTLPATGLDTLSAGTVAENENIAFDLAYLTYVSPIGIFTAGYQIDGAWGTVFGDNSIPTGKITYAMVKGPVAVGIQMGKINDREGSVTAKNPMTPATAASDRDGSFYTAFARYSWKTGQVGLLEKWIDVRSFRGAGFTSQYLATLPYAKAKLGPVDLQAELIWLYGKARKYESSATDIQKNTLSAWVDATADLGMFYVGGTVAYLSGQDPNEADKSTASDGGLDWNPCLILFNNDLNYWAGNYSNAVGNTGTGNPTTTMTNAWFFQVKGGVKPVDKLDIGMSVSYANAVVKPTNAWLYNDYGYEVDLTATYKITNNLSYMLGGGYLFTGKFYKGANDALDMQNNFMVINKLTLTF